MPNCATGSIETLSPQQEGTAQAMHLGQHFTCLVQYCVILMGRKGIKEPQASHHNVMENITFPVTNNTPAHAVTAMQTLHNRRLQQHIALPLLL